MNKWRIRETRIGKNCINVKTRNHHFSASDILKELCLLALACFLICSKAHSLFSSIHHLQWADAHFSNDICLAKAISDTSCTHYHQRKKPYRLKSFLTGRQTQCQVILNCSPFINQGRESLDKPIMLR